MANFGDEFRENTRKFFSKDVTEQLQAQKYFLFLIKDLNVPDVIVDILQKATDLEICYMASSILTELLMKKWSIFTVNHKIFIYTFTIKIIANSSQSHIQKSYLDCFIRLVCKLSIQSWNEDVEFSKLPQYCAEFLQQGPEIVVIGLKIIKQLIEEMQTGSKYSSIHHERTSKQFKQFTIPSLFKLFLSCLEKFSSINIASELIPVLELVLEIMTKIFDFCKENDDKFELILPWPDSDCWQILKTPEIIDFFNRTFAQNTSNSNIVQKILKIYGHLVTVNASFFPDLQIKSLILKKIVSFIIELLSNRHGINCENDLHEFVWILSRIGGSELAMDIVFQIDPQGFIEKSYNLTKEILQNRVSENLIYNIMTFWEFLSVTSIKKPELYQIIEEVTKIYIQYLLNNDDVLSNTRENQLGCHIENNDPYSISCSSTPDKESLALLASLSKVQHQNLSEWVLQFFESLVNSLVTNNTYSPQLIIIINILGAFIADNKSQFIANADKHNKNPKVSIKTLNTDNYLISGKIASHIFIFLKHLLQYPTLNTPLLQCLLNFIKLFIRLYINCDNPLVSSTFQYLRTQLSLEADDHILLIILSSIFTAASRQNANVFQLSMEIFADIGNFTRLLKPSIDHDSVCYCGILRFNEQSILEILGNWCSGELTFINQHLPSKSRAECIKSIFKLYFLVGNNTNLTFLHMIQPIDNMLKLTKQSYALEKATGLCYDLLGMLQSIANSDHYSLFFNWLCNISEDLINVFGHFSASPRTCVFYFNFLKELCFNRTERLTYLENSSIGTSLFRFCQRILDTFFNAFVVKDCYENVYEELYKPLAMAVNVLANASFGVKNFQLLIGNKDVINTFNVVIKCIVAIPAEEISACVKIFKGVFELFKFVTGQQKLMKETIYKLGQGEVGKFFDLMIEGCQSSEQFVCQLSYFILKDVVTDMIFKASDESRNFLLANDNSLKRLLRVLLVLVFNGEGQNISLIAYPLLGLINIFKQFYIEIIPSICQVQGPERSNLVKSSIESLFTNLQFSWSDEHFHRNMKSAQEFEKRLNIVAKSLKLSI
ncbi:hypothetical protein SteCoe_29210 [Stentor coeruleus]|uniref:Importin N-terminal domain-containing protein n=1 Tax=Stentor coeruleus TaxID=5963 RepID=A0A1R2B6I3_9CILI|nr:hypothetical protein SteCoe_29210 [Stentor coeruleus]